MTFYFAGSRSTDLHRVFRDGPRDLPEYLAELMNGIETEDFTYDEAIALVNQSMLGRVTGSTLGSVIGDHLREVRRDGSR
jgi:hypothetical protein